ncbi:COX15/CtaA family protein [Alphaproteobacteria bacterium]|nr:COX15/CtaA family protein [Alphaproteobacteria bacterium]
MTPNPSSLPLSSDHTAIIRWLAFMAIMVALMVVIGGVTRLTGSGLSMVEWRPIMGTLPPLSGDEWQRVFTLYQASPEFQEINSDMDMAGFKWIFFWEYFHRLWGRLLGFCFFIPLVYFWLRGRIPAGYKLPLVGLLFLGGFQGVVGWWMVTSGLVDDPTVSQYRLASHLSVALIIFSGLIWTSANLAYGHTRWPKGHNLATLLLVAITILAGAFVAGMDAGLLYNEYPLMGDGLVPYEYGEEGVWDAFENPASAQFHHRWLAVLAVIAVIGVVAKLYRQGHRHLAMMLGAIIFLQFALGLITLLLGVPVWAGAMHQTGAVALLAATLLSVHRLSR